MAEPTALARSQMVPRHPGGTVAWVLVCLLTALVLALAVAVDRFRYGIDILGQPVPEVIALYVSAAAVYLLLCRRVARAGPDVPPLPWLVVAGVVMRAAMLATGTGAETDFYRYLWDGSLTARGLNPYSYAPQQVTDALAGRGAVPPEVLEVARQSGPVIHRVNNPRVKTAYPPAAQAAFALAHLLGPWSVSAWRAVLLACDGAAMALLVVLLRRAGRPAAWAAVYWLNPLVVRETLNSGHMDVVALPFVLAAVWAATRKGWSLSAALLALAVTTKVWPLVLLPLLLRPTWKCPRRLLAALVTFALLSAALWWPVVAASGGTPGASGFDAYAKYWVNNAPWFGVVASFGERLLGRLGVAAMPGWAFARLIAAAGLVAWVIWLARKRAESAARLYDTCALAVAAALLLSPSLFPWYYVWLAPLVALRPRFPLLLLTAALPLFYLSAYLEARPGTAKLATAVLWLEHLSVWCAIAWSALRRLRQSRREPSDT